jgi:hypothetical protein
MERALDNGLELGVEFQQRSVLETWLYLLMRQRRLPERCLVRMDSTTDFQPDVA